MIIAHPEGNKVRSPLLKASFKGMRPVQPHRTPHLEGPHLISLVAQTVKQWPTMQETLVRSLSQEDHLEKEMATHSSILAWKTPWTEDPVRLQSMGSQRVGHNWATSLHFTSPDLLLCCQHPEIIILRKSSWVLFCTGPHQLCSPFWFHRQDKS